MTRIYHNPRCSKSCATLALLQDMGIRPEIVYYLETPPDAKTLRRIAAALDCPVDALLRPGESRYRELGLAGRKYREEELLRLVMANPILLQRPIVTHHGRAAIGRPPGNVLTLFDHSTRYRSSS